MYLFCFLLSFLSPIKNSLSTSCTYDNGRSPPSVDHIDASRGTLMTGSSYGDSPSVGNFLAALTRMTMVASAPARKFPAIPASAVGIPMVHVPWCELLY